MRIYERLTRWQQRRKMRSWAAADPRAHDLYLVEFPKSGMTWLSTLVANMALSEAGSAQRVTYFNVQNYVLDIHMAQGRALGPSLLPVLPQRVIKSHHRQNPYYQNVVYLVRHPVAVMRSMINYLPQTRGYPMTQEDVLNDPLMGIEAWRRHVRGWLIDASMSWQRLHLMRYDSLVSDARSELGLLVENLGWPISDDAITQAIENASVEHMKTSEQLYRRMNPAYKMAFVKGATDELSTSAKARIAEACREELTLLGYEDA